MLTLADKHLALASINCPQPVKSEIYLNEENLICLKFYCSWHLVKKSTTKRASKMLELICVIIINALINVIFEDNWKPFIVLVILYLFCSFMGLLS